MKQHLRVRCEQRLAKIKKDKDEGVYAKQYTEDVTELMKEIEQLEAEYESLAQATDPFLSDD